MAMTPDELNSKLQVEDTFERSIRFVIVLPTHCKIDEVSRTLGVAPDFSHTHGEKFQMLGRIHYRPDTVWGIHSIEPVSLDIGLSDIISRMEHSKAELTYFIESAECEVYILVQLDSNLGVDGLIMSVDNLSRLQGLCNYLMVAPYQLTWKGDTP